MVGNLGLGASGGMMLHPKLYPDPIGGASVIRFSLLDASARAGGPANQTFGTGVRKRSVRGSAG